MDKVKIELHDGNQIRVIGDLDGKGADELILTMSPQVNYFVDLEESSNINFSALRSLLRARQDGLHFVVTNACDKIAEMFEDTGVSRFIGVCRKPKPLDIGKYEEFGGGFLSKAFNSPDGDSMIKVYGANVPMWMVNQEKMTAKAVMQFGIPTPLVGSVYTDGKLNGIDFERIEGKKSFSRIISEDPSRTEELIEKFAGMCRKLHSTPCDTNMFSDRTFFYRRAVVNCSEISDDEKQKVLSFVDSIPCATTCLHGDMQISNVITNGKDDLWIDLADFGYGNPMLDLGMWYFLSNLNTEEISLDVFHMGVKEMANIWKIFAKFYFDADTPEKLEAANNKVIPFAALHMLYLGSSYGFRPHMLPFIRKVLL